MAQDVVICDIDRALRINDRSQLSIYSSVRETTGNVGA